MLSNLAWETDVLQKRCELNGMTTIAAKCVRVVDNDMEEWE